MEREAVLFSAFQPNDEFNLFLNELGYTGPFYCYNFDIMFDQRVVDFIKNKLEGFRGQQVYKGKPSVDRLIGFCGIAKIVNVDTSRKWVIRHDNLDIPYIKYIDVFTNKYGYTIIK